MFRELAEDIVFLLIMKKILDIERRDAAIRWTERVLKILCTVLLTGMLFFIIYHVLKEGISWAMPSKTCWSASKKS